MCGIAGFSGPPEPEILEEMVRSLAHRGPDEEGFLSDGRMNLGQRRLAIVDIESGRQPISNEDETIRLVYNGEVYRVAEWIRRLEGLGHKFRTRSDTEVLVHAYEEYGDSFLEKLNGMFALALWDSRKNRLLLARDRAGIKPLYYARLGGRILFGSEIKAILAWPGFEKKLNHEALHHYLSLKHVPGPQTIYQGIESLPPGGLMIWQEGRAEIRKWWELKFRPEKGLALEETAEELARLIRDAVRIRMVADVTVGAYLSGGLDSSAVTALMAEEAGGRIKTFSLDYEDGFEHKRADAVMAAKVSRLFGTEHYNYVMRAGEVKKNLPRILAAFDQPFGGVTSTFFLTGLISEHVKCTLSGDGADELFGSYLAPRLAQPIDRYLRLGPGAAGRNLSRAEIQSLVPFQDQVDFVAGLADPETWRWRARLLTFSEEEKRGLYSGKGLDLAGKTDTTGYVRQVFNGIESDDPLGRVLEFDFKTLLADNVLPFVDRLSMAHSVENRVPWLDHRIMELAARMPGPFKIRDDTVKYVQKLALKRLLPKEVVWRPKEGFVLPLNQWMEGVLADWVKETLAPERLATHGLFDHGAVADMLREQYRGLADHRYKLWNLVSFQVWYETCFV